MFVDGFQVRRLLYEGLPRYDDGEKHSVRIVRLGQLSRVHPSVQRVSLDALVEHHIADQLRMRDNLDKRIADLKVCIRFDYN